MEFDKVKYSDLNARQKENYNFHKVSSKLVEYGFQSILLSDDWLGADFIAMHSNGKDFLRVQLKSRLSLQKKYIGKNLWIAYRNHKTKKIYLYEHDKMVDLIASVSPYQNNKAWIEDGNVHWGNPSKAIVSVLEEYRL